MKVKVDVGLLRQEPLRKHIVDRSSSYAVGTLVDYMIEHCEPKGPKVLAAYVSSSMFQFQSAPYFTN